MIISTSKQGQWAFSITNDASSEVTVLINKFFEVSDIFKPGVRNAVSFHPTCARQLERKAHFGEIFEEGVGLYCMKYACIIHGVIDPGQFALKSVAHQTQLPSSFQIRVGLKITHWFLMGDNGYGQPKPFRQRLRTSSPKLEMQRTSKITAKTDTLG